MEKKGEILNQLAIISDLVERLNLESTTSTITLTLNEVEFNRVYKIIKEKTKDNMGEVKGSFAISIGEVDILFNMNSV
jgi:hypothetical protein